MEEREDADFLLGRCKAGLGSRGRLENVENLPMYLAAMEHRALLVHNEPFLSEMRNVLSETLRGAYRIDAAHNSRDAIKLLETNRFDVVVTGLVVNGHMTSGPDMRVSDVRG